MLKLEVIKNITYNYDCFIIPFASNKKCNGLPKEIQLVVDIAIKDGLFKAEKSEIYVTSAVINDKIVNLLMVGIGEEKKLNNGLIFNYMLSAFSKAKSLEMTNIAVLWDNIIDLLNYGYCEKACEVAILTDYELTQFKSTYTKKPFDTVTFISEYDEMVEAIKEAKICAEGTNVARNLIDTPAIIMTPSKMAEEAFNISEKNNMNCEILGVESIKQLKMDAFLSVGKGSANEPKLIVIRYKGDPSNSSVIGLVGKGLNFDSGGYSMKSSESMYSMHGDMGGAAACIGAMKAISDMKLKINVTMVVAACENRVSSNAYLPGDVVKSMSGKFIEIADTDAEGRVTMCDAITYAIRNEGADKIIDIATLTGSVKGALGNKTAGLITNDENMHKILEEASKASGEKVWLLPLDEELKYVIDSKKADMKNCSNGENAGGGCIVAGLFLQEFVEGKSWIHIDIAGAEWYHNISNYCSNGSSGFGTRLLYNVFKIMSDK